MFVKGLFIADPRTTAGEIPIVVNGDINPTVVSLVIKGNKTSPNSPILLLYPTRLCQIP